MLELALIIGFYSYSILLLGLFKFLDFFPIFLVSAIFTLIAFIFFLKSVLNELFIFKEKIKTITKLEFFFISTLFLSVIVNLLGSLGPELSFDALWYHLTIPKLFINAHSIYFIKGELLYYSLWPKLTEMLYIAGLMFSSEILAKLIHFTFGILTAVAVYKIARLYISRSNSIIAALIFYSNLVVAWLSITAFVDLTRSFYEAMALLFFLKYTKDFKKRNFILSAVLLGFAISTKLLSIVSMLIFIVLIFSTNNVRTKEKIINSVKYLFIAFLVPLPYFIISFFNTGNPFYPLFTKLTSSYFSLQLINPLNFIKSFFDVFLFSPDPLNPIYLIVLPLIFFAFRKTFLKVRYIVVYAIVSFIVFYLTPQTGGGRFIVAYLPIFSVLSAVCISNLKKNTRIILTTAVALIALISIFYRFAANLRFVPVILGYQTKNDFLMKNLNFSFGDFYDNNYEIKRIVGNNKVMVVGIHNLYYIDFPFTIPEWGRGGNEKFTLIYDSSINKKIEKERILYKNPITHVTLYKNYVE